MSAGIEVVDPQERMVLHLFRVMPAAWQPAALSLAVNLSAGMPVEEARKVFVAECAAAEAGAA